MVAKDTSCGSETYRPYLDIERIINIQSTCSINRGHEPASFTMAALKLHTLPSITGTVVLLNLNIFPVDNEQLLDINFAVFLNTGTRPR